MQRAISLSTRSRLLPRKRREHSCIPSISARISSTSSTFPSRINPPNYFYFSTSSALKPLNFESIDKANHAVKTEEYSFRHELTNFYKAAHDLSLKDAFETKKIFSGNTDPSTLWTATFECPVTGESISAGKLPGSEFRIEKDGTIYYANKKISIQAAAMEAMNHSHITSNKSTKDSDKVYSKRTTSKTKLVTWYMKNHKLGLGDDSFTTKKKSFVGKKNGGIWWTASFTCPKTGEVYKPIELESEDALYRDHDGCRWYRRKNDAIEAAAAHALYINVLEESEVIESEDADTEEEELSEIRNTSSNGSHNSTRAPLNAWYEKEHQIELSDENYVVSMASFKGKVIGGNWWTASFICPVTGDSFGSGSLVDAEFHKDSDNLIWYKKKEESMVAAALCALDTLRFKKFGDTEPRYCQEDPREAVSDESSVVLPDLLQDKKGSLEEETLSTEKVMFAKTDVLEEAEVEDDDDDYIIEIVPQRIGSINASGPEIANSTLDLIADTLIESTSTSRIRDTTKSFFWSPTGKRQEAIDRAMTWIASQQDRRNDDDYDGERSWFEGQGQRTNVKIANFILESLAHAKRHLPFENTRSGVEDAASAVLEYMWSSQSIRPDASSYASFLKCLEDDSPSDMVKKAQSIYDAMMSGSKYKGRVLPKPDITVYNSLIQCLAEGGMETKLNDLDPKMKPNRETFLSVLSSMSQIPIDRNQDGIFEAKNALAYIEKMKVLSDESSDSSLVPDIEVYNAPLSWIGGQLSASSRPYSRSIPWDSYDKIFQKGFKVLLKDHPLFEEALKFESWFESMRSGEFGSHIKPDIETYESLIQAWVRTGTREGLEKAEEFALKLMNDMSIEARLQTFHPIIAGWVYSGANDGPERVESWLKRLNDFGFGVTSDGRYQLAPILARVSQQRDLLRNHDVYQLLDGKESDFQSLATENSLCLSEMIRNFKTNDNSTLLADAFALVIQSWHNVGYVYSRMGDSDGAALALSKMQNTVKQFCDVVQTIHESDGERSLMQLLHLLGASPEIFSAVLFSMKEFDKIESQRPSHEQKMSHLMKNLSVLEQHIRRSEEFRLCLEESLARASSFNMDQQMFNSGFQLLYPDLFSLRSGMFVKDPSTWLQFYAAIMEALDTGKINPDKATDVLRICTLMTDVLKMQNQHPNNMVSTHMLKVLNKFSEEPGQSALFEAVKEVYKVPYHSKPDRKSKATTTQQTKNITSGKKGLRRRRQAQNNRRSLSNQNRGASEQLLSSKKQHASS